MTTTETEHAKKREAFDYWLMFGGAAVIAGIALVFGASAVATALLVLGWFAFGWIGSSPNQGPVADEGFEHQTDNSEGTLVQPETDEDAGLTDGPAMRRAKGFSRGWLLVRVFGILMLVVLWSSPEEFFTAENTLQKVSEWMAVAFVIALVLAPRAALAAVVAALLGAISLWKDSSRFAQAPAFSGEIVSPRDAERWVAEWMRGAGFRGVSLTPPSGDMGLDVVADGWSVQVKRTAAPVGRPVLQALVGATRQGSSPACFSSGGYTSGAIQYARERGVRLYTFSPNGIGDPKRDW